MIISTTDTSLENGFPLKSQLQPVKPLENPMAIPRKSLLLQPKLDLDTVNAELENKTPQQIIQWAYDTFGPRLAMQSSMQKTASALSHMVYRLRIDLDILFVDTQFHFQETLITRDKLAVKYGLRILTLTPAQSPQDQYEKYGRNLYEKDGDYQTCCHLRKEIPFVSFVEPRYDAVISGLMRSEGGKRANLKIVSYDERIKAYKVNPLANWNEERVDSYNDENEVPVNPLHELGFPSIGCSPCTTPVEPGEDRRAGRWRHIREAKAEFVTHLYCGINREDK